jgi:transmembrane sensor
MSHEEDIDGGGSDSALAAAATWLVHLQRPNREAAVDEAFKAWLKAPDHAAAFARATEAWEIIPGAAQLAMAPAEAVQASPRRCLRRFAPGLAVAGLVAAAALGTGTYLLRQPVYITRTGQQEAITLADGTRVGLNTDSRLVVEFSHAERRVRLERGEAMFEVTKNPHRPFVVQVADEQVRALGTTFTVRKDAGRVAVVLVEGRVEVTRVAPSSHRPMRVAVLVPGERLTVRADAGAAVDRPDIVTATAWRQGEVMFDDATLLDAVAELNRYGGRQVQVGDPKIAALSISGVFQTNDPAAFAETVAALHHLQVERVDDTLILKR